MRILHVASYLFSLYIASCSSSEVRWLIDEIEAGEGGDVTATCRIKGSNMFSVVRLDRERNGHVITISDNRYFKHLFDGLARYKLDYAKLEDEVNLTLSINGIKSRDTGRIRCYDLADESDKQIFDLKVLAPIDKIYFFLSKNNTLPELDLELKVEDDSITLEPDTDTEMVGFIGCRAKAETEDVSVKLEGPKDEAVFNTIDVTKLQEEPITEGDLPSTMFTSRATFVSTDSRFNGKKITCTGFGASSNNITISAYINLKFRPEGECTSSLIEDDVFSVECVITSNPSFKVHVLDEDEQVAAEAIVTEKALGGDKVGLKVSNLNASLLYNLIIGNSVGTITIPVEAKRVEDVQEEEEEEVVEKVVDNLQEQPSHGQGGYNKMAVVGEQKNLASSQVGRWAIYWKLPLVITFYSTFFYTFRN